MARERSLALVGNLYSDDVMIKVLVGGIQKTHLIFFMMYKSQKSIRDQGIPELPVGRVKVSEPPWPRSSSGQHFWCWGIEFVRRSQNDYR